MATTHSVTPKDSKHRSTQNQTHFHSTSTRNIFSSRQQPFSKSSLPSSSLVGIRRKLPALSSSLTSYSLSSSSRFIFFNLWQEEWFEQPLSSILFSRLQTTHQICADNMRERPTWEITRRLIKPREETAPKSRNK